MPTVPPKKTAVKIRKNDGAGGSTGTSLTARIGNIFTMKGLYENKFSILAIIVAIFGYILYNKSQAVIRDLVNVDSEVLKDVIFGEKPYLFYCDRGTPNQNRGNIPAIFSDLNIMKANKLGFAVVNCSQVLPSGKSMWDRFKLKKEWKPVIWGSAPWTKPIQAHPTDLKDVTSLKKFIEDSLSPKATEMKTDQQLTTFCGFTAKNIVYDDRDISETCFVIVKGTRYTKVQQSLESKLVAAYPRSKFAMIDGSKTRLSMEDIETLPADHFAMRIHALRNGTHYFTMVNPVTWDYVNTFLSKALAMPLYDYDSVAGDAALLAATGTEKVQVWKMKQFYEMKDRKARKEKKQQQAAAADGNGGKKPSKPAKTSSTSGSSSNSDRSSHSSSSSKVKVKDTTTESQKEEAKEETVPSTAEVDEEAIRLEQVRRERLRREQMERMEREHVFEAVEDDETVGGEGSNGEEEESNGEEVADGDDYDSIIEL